MDAAVTAIVQVCDATMLNRFLWLGPIMLNELLNSSNKQIIVSQGTIVAIIVS
jgi:hypothetical protein